MDKIEENAVAVRVAQDLDALERGLDDVISRFGRLTSSVADGRVDLGLSACYGHDVFERLAPIGPSLVAARSEIVTLHGRLGVIQRHRRLTSGPIVEKGDTFALEDREPLAQEPAQRLRVIS